MFINKKCPASASNSAFSLISSHHQAIKIDFWGRGVRHRFIHEHYGIMTCTISNPLYVVYTIYGFTQLREVPTPLDFRPNLFQHVTTSQLQAMINSFPSLTTKSYMKHSTLTFQFDPTNYLIYML